MGAPTKDGKVWRHRVMVNGKRTSGTFDTKAAALAWEAQQRTEPASGKATTQTCKDAFEKYELDVSRKKAGHRWEALRLAAFGRSDLGAVLIRDLDESHVAKWRDMRLKTVKGSTVNRELNLMSNVFSRARDEWKWIKASPTTKVKRPKNSKPRVRRISENEIAQICHALGWQEAAPKTKQQTIAAAFLFAIETGMRAGEILSLNAGSVAGRVAHLVNTKNGDERDVPLSPRALEIWGMVPDGFDVNSGSLDTMFRTARTERTTIEGLTFHDTRHEAITRLAKKLHVLDLARMVGHKDIRKLMVYYNLAAEEVADKL